MAQYARLSRAEAESELTRREAARERSAAENEERDRREQQRKRAEQAEQQRQERQRAERQAEFEQAAHERGAQELDSERQRLRDAWVRNGGTDSEFVAAWPRLKSDLLAQRTQAERESVSIKALWRP